MPHTLKLLEEGVECTLQLPGTGKNFMKRTVVPQEKRSTVDKWHLSKQRRNWLIKGRGSPRNGRKIFVSYTFDRRLVSLSVQRTKNLNIKKMNYQLKIGYGT